MKLNNKGYMLVEIILASVIAFGIAYFILDLTIKLKNKNDDLLVETQVVTDRTIITNKLMKYAIAEGKNFNCSLVNPSGNTISYDDQEIDVLNKYTTFTGEYYCENNEESGEINIDIPLNIPQMSDKDYNIKLNYKYKIPLITKITYDWNVNLFTTSSGDTDAKITYSYSENTLTFDGTWDECSEDITNCVPYHHIHLGSSANNLNVKPTDTYKMTLEYISGGYETSIIGTTSDNPPQDYTDLYITPKKTSGENGESLDITTKIPLPTVDNRVTSGIVTLNTEIINSADYFYFWLHKKDYNKTIFDNYQVKVRFTRYEDVVNKYESAYVLPEEEPGINPTNTTYTFDDWYTEISSGTKFNANTLVTEDSPKTLYAHYALSDTTSPTCTLQASGSTVSFSSKNDNIGVTAYGLNNSATASYNSTNSLSIAEATFYGHVKDAAGNIGTCSITIKKNVTATYTCRHNYDACAKGYKRWDACYSTGSYCPRKKCDSNGNCTTCSCYGATHYGDYCYSFISQYNACSSGTKTGGYCYKYKQSSCASGWTKTATNYSCPSGWSKITNNNTYCYK